MLLGLTESRDADAPPGERRARSADRRPRGIQRDRPRDDRWGPTGFSHRPRPLRIPRLPTRPTGAGRSQVRTAASAGARPDRALAAEPCARTTRRSRPGGAAPIVRVDSATFPRFRAPSRLSIRRGTGNPRATTGKRWSSAARRRCLDRLLRRGARLACRVGPVPAPSRRTATRLRPANVCYPGGYRGEARPTTPSVRPSVRYPPRRARTCPSVERSSGWER